jgi:hypothetical protein
VRLNVEDVRPGVVQERHTPLETKLIQDELGRDLEELTQIQSRVELLANLVQVTVNADLIVELPLKLIEFVLGSYEALDLVRQASVLIL